MCLTFWSRQGLGTDVGHDQDVLCWDRLGGQLEGLLLAPRQQPDETLGNLPSNSIGEGTHRPGTLSGGRQRSPRGALHPLEAAD